MPAPTKTRKRAYMWPMLAKYLSEKGLVNEDDLKVRCRIRALVAGDPAASFSKNTGIARGPKEGVAARQLLKGSMNIILCNRNGSTTVVPTLALVANHP